MAEPVSSGEHNLLTSKVGKIPVWVLALGGLVLAWLYAKWRDTKAAAAAANTEQVATADAAQGQDVAPQFIIENNMPPDVGAPSQPSAPVTPTNPPPVITPPGKGPNPPTTKPPVKTPNPPKKTAKKPIVYRVQHGDTLDSIAKKHHTTWQALWKYNTTPGNRPASTIATLKKRGPSLLYAGEEIDIPQ